MAETKERMRHLRKRREARGEKAAVIWFTQAGHERLNRLRRHGENMSQVVDRGLAALEREHAPVPRIIITDVSTVTTDVTTDVNTDDVSPVPCKAPEAKAPVFSGQRRDILALLHQHPEGLSPVQTRQLLGIQKDLGSTMKCMARDGFLHRVRPGIYTIEERG